MNLRIKCFAVVLALVCISVNCFGLESANNAPNPLKLVYAEVNPLNSYSGYLAKLFKQRVEDLSKGSVIIDIKSGGELGNDNEVLTSMYQKNNPDILRTSVSYLQDYGAYKAAMLSTPYMFANREHYWKFIKSGIYKEFLDEISIMGSRFKALCFIEEGYRHFFSRKPITDLSDLAGLKIRSAYGNYFEDLIKVFDATGVSVPFKNLAEALKTGVVDGAEQPVLNYLSNELYVWAPYLVLDGHVLALSEIIISDDVWSKMNLEQQTIILRAADYVQRVNKVTIKDVEKKCIEELIDNGVIVTEISDRDNWKEKCSELIFKTTKVYSDLYNEIQELK